MCESSLTFSGLLELIPGAWFVIRKDGSFVYVNRAACESLGYSPEELRALTLFDIDPSVPRDEQGVVCVSRDAAAHLPVRTTHRRRDGSVIPVEIRSSPLQVDGEDYAVSYAVDLSGTHATERLNRLLLEALEHTAEALVVTDAEGLVEFVNPAYERSTGILAANAKGHPWLTLDVAGIPEVAAAVEQVFSHGATWQGQFQGKRRSGQAFWESATISPIRDHSGAIVGCVSVIRDITRQLELERQLRQAQKMEAVGQLAGGIAHDFNNILHVIQGTATVLARGRGSVDQAELLDELLGATERARQLIRQLLTFSRTQSARPVDIDLGHSIEATLSMLKRLLGEHISISWDNRASGAIVLGNAAQLQQVIMNLCINARDAMPEGGELRLSLERVAAPAIPHSLRDSEASSAYRFSVADTGHGIAEEHHERIFEPFYTTKAPGQGTGLGLATVYRIVESHGGAVRVESRPGAGSRFDVYLPSSNGEESHAPSRDSRVEALGAGRLALVAEDDPAVRRLTARYLTDAGFRVLEAADGDDALAQFEAWGEAVSVGVLDAVMPRRGGLEVYAALRRRGLTVPVLFVTGYDYDRLPNSGTLDAAATLHKPFDGNTLLTTLAELLAESTVPGLRICAR